MMDKVITEGELFSALFIEDYFLDKYIFYKNEKE